MQFQLTTATRAVLATMTVRTEHHGDEKVPAVTLGLKITGPNTVLDNFGKPYDFRHALYTAPEGQEQFEGIDNTPDLRSVGMEAIKLAVPKLEGWRLLVDHGIDESDPIDMGNCSVSKFRLEPFQGGSCELSFIVSTDDVDAEYLGLLGAKLGQELSIRLLAPEPKPEAIDGSVEAFERDHPGADDDDAADLFARNEEAGLNKDAADVPQPKKRRSNKPSLAVVD